VTFLLSHTSDTFPDIITISLTIHGGRVPVLTGYLSLFFLQPFPLSALPHHHTCLSWNAIINIQQNKSVKNCCKKSYKIGKMLPKMILASTIKWNDIIINHITICHVNAIEKL